MGMGDLSKKISSKLGPLAERVAAEHGYTSAKQAAEKMGATFTRLVEQAQEAITEKFAGKPSTKLTPEASQELRGLSEKFDKPNFELVGKPFDPNDDFNPDLANLYDTRTGAEKYDSSNLPVLAGERMPVPTGPMEGRVIDVTPGSKSQNKGLFAGTGLAGIGLAMAAGGDTRKEESAPAEETPAPAPAPATTNSTASLMEAIGDNLDKKEKETLKRTQLPLPKAPTEEEKAVKNRDEDYRKSIALLKREGVDVSDLDEQRKEAKKDYEDTKNLQSWLSLAQMISNSIGNYAAAVWGSKHGTGQAQLPNLAASDVDYQSRIKNARSDYESDRADIDAEKGFRYKQARDQYETNKDIVQAKKDALAEARALYNSKLSEYGANMRAYTAEQQAQERYERDEARLEEAAKRNDRTLAATILNNSQEDERSLDRQIQNINTNLAIASNPDAKPERVSAAIEYLGAQANLSPEQIAAAQTDAAQKRWLIPDKKHPEVASRAVISNYAAALQARLERVKSNRARAEQMLGMTPTSGTYTPGQPATPSGTIRMRHNESGAERDVTPEEAALLPKDKFTRVK